MSAQESVNQLQHFLCLPSDISITLGSDKIKAWLGLFISPPKPHNSAVAHNSDSSKTTIQSKWKAPSSGNSKNIEFRATFVKDYSNFWVGVKSSVVNYRGTAGSSTQSPSISGSGSSTVSGSGCGSTKTCFSEPSGCDPSTDSTCYFMSATPPSSGAQYKFEIVGSADGYVSIGFSDDKEMVRIISVRAEFRSPDRIGAPLAHLMSHTPVPHQVPFTRPSQLTVKHPSFLRQY
ncbi:hypothetical protein NFI96_023701 [Prochilodus magdalenae]|nr:hypothetical protein NFI96_023701 [Prochilodus magdalenae]